MIDVLATCLLKPNRTVTSCDPDFYWGRQVGYGKKWSFDSSHVALSQHLLSFLYASIGAWWCKLQRSGN